MNNQEKKTYQKITEKIYRACKIMLKGGATLKEVAEYMDISINTAGRINRAETFEEYKNIAYSEGYLFKKKKAAEEAAAKQVQAQATQAPAEPPKQVVEYKQSVTIQATHYMETELKKQTELLTMISNKLAFIVEELAGPVKEAK